MKRNLFQSMVSGMLVLLSISGCTEDAEMKHTQVSPVDALYAPEDNTFYNLGAQSSAVFEWKAALAADNGVVLYEVAFDTEEGDFSNPIYVLPSDGRGIQRRLNLPFSELNSIAQLAGIGPEETGKLKWTVMSSKGINVQESQVSRVIEVERPAGFPAPDELYITGSATESGENIEEAVLTKRTGANTFEVYTTLAEGSYHFIDRKSENASSYYIDGDRLRAGGETGVEGEETLYRIRLNFSSGTVEVQTIEQMELWFAPDGEFLFELPYAGNGTWKAEDVQIEFKQEDWGRDERYKFRLMVKDESGNSEEEWYGSTNSDNQRPAADSNASYWHMVPVSDDRWSHSFKFQTEVDNSSVDIQVIFNAAVSSYTHEINIR